MAKNNEAPSDRTRLRRYHQRGAYDHETIAAILDAQPFCTVAYTLEGSPVITPTFQWREGDHVYWHGSSASRTIKKSTANDVCMNVSILDGFVLARAAMHHSANFRSVTIFGQARKIEDKDEKEARLKGFMDALFPGRWDVLRPMTEQEVKATTVLTMPIEEASAKVRTGPPGDDEEDYELPIWAGVLPVETVSTSLVPDQRNLADVPVPDHLMGFQFKP